MPFISEGTYSFKRNKKQRDSQEHPNIHFKCAKCQKVSAIMNIFPCKILISFRVVQKYKRTLFSLLDIQFFNCKYFYSIQHQTKNLLRILNTELKNTEKKKKISWHWRENDIWLLEPVKSNCSGILSRAHQATVLAGKRFGSQTACVQIPALQPEGWITLGKSTYLLCVSVSSSL